MSQPLLIVCNVVAIVLLVFGLYYPRHRRRDMIPALLGINVALLGITMTLTRTEVNLGLGLGLFGVLSIIRLRSNELGQQEIAYYFTALALGLLAGMPIDPSWATPTLMAAILFAMFVGDHPQLFSDSRSKTLTLDKAYLDEKELAERLGSLLGKKILKVNVRRVDLVNDSTVVNVRYRVEADSDE